MGRRGSGPGTVTQIAAQRVTRASGRRVAVGRRRATEARNRLRGAEGLTRAERVQRGGRNIRRALRRG